MNSFDFEIKQFLVNGTFENNFDDAGNINLFSEPTNVNEKYIAFDLNNYLYDNDKIKSLYDVEIKEFNIPITTQLTLSNITSSITSSAEQLFQENEILKSQLNAIIETSNQNSSSALIDASKDTIISLRIQLQEGNTPDDFSDEFPYLKK